MLVGEIRNQVDRVWDAFWTGGISNPLEVIEQLTYLLFIKRLDEIHTKATLQIQSGLTARPIFSPEQEHFRWSLLKELEPKKMYEVINTELFPFIRTLASEEDTAGRHMKDARFTLPPEKASLLTRVVDMISQIDMNDRDTTGDLYEYLLSKLATAGQNGQFRTPRHIIKMMVEMVNPSPTDQICDPACGTAGFLVAAAEHIDHHHRPKLFTNETLRQQFASGKLLHGFDFDSTMLRIASMNLLLHGFSNPDIRNKDSLAQSASSDAEAYSLILANPPFAGSLDQETIAKDLHQMVNTKKTELLFVALFLRLLKPGGRAAVIVPDGVLFGSSNAHKRLREILVTQHQLQAVISMPSGVFKPYAGVSTAILFFTKTGVGGTDQVWFYDMQADGYSLDDKRTELDGSQHAHNNIPDILHRWQNLPAEKDRSRTAQSFFVSQAEIAANGYDLSLNRYKEIVYETVEYDPPAQILAELEQLEAEISAGLAELKQMI